MANYYKISKAQADTLGKITYATSQAFDPYVNEQADGTFLVSEKMYDILKDHLNFKQLTWAQLTKITDAQIQTKGGGGGGAKTADGGTK